MDASRNGLAWTVPYIGIPFVAHGRNARGCDCWGLVHLVLEREFGARGLPEFAYDSVRGREAAAHFAREMPRWTSVTVPEPGDVVVLSFAGAPRHVGLVAQVRPLLMLTIDTGTASCLERLDSPKWAGRVEGFFRWQNP